MKLVIFEAEPREASAFPTNDVLLVAEPLRAGMARRQMSVSTSKADTTWPLAMGLRT
jgi:hypothetical protein